MISISEENVKSILEMIEDLVLNSAKIPILNKLIIDEDKLFGLLDELTKNLPVEMSESIEIVQNKERIMFEANSRATELVSNAEMKASVLVSNSEVLKKALLEVENLKREFNREVEQKQLQVNAEIQQKQIQVNEEIKLKTGEVDKYADSILENLENQITNAITVIRNGKERLSQS